MDPQHELVIRKIASLSDTGLQAKDIAKQLNLTTHQVTRLMKTDEYRDLCIKIGDAYISEAKSKWQRGCAGLLDKCLSVMRSNLDQGSLKAVELAIKSLGIMTQEDKAGDSTINIVLPQGVEPTPVEVEAHDVTAASHHHGDST